MVFHRSSGQAETVFCLQVTEQSSGGGIRVLDRLRLIQHRYVPVAGKQGFLIPRDQRIGRQYDVMPGNDVELLFAVGAVKHQDL